MKALVLAAGFPQIALIKELKSRNIEVVVADYNQEPVAKPYADEYSQTSTLDVHAIEALAINKSIDFIVTVCTDQAVLTMAKVSEDLGLPCYIDYKTALNVTNKQHMKAVFEKNGIPTARHVTLKELNYEEIDHLQFPLMVKPADCNSSKGVRKCYDYQELEQYFLDAVRFSRSDTAVIEEYINGTEVSVDVYVENGKAHILCVSESDKIKDDNKFIIFRALWPSPVSEKVLNKIQTVAQQITDAFGLKNTPMLVQMLVEQDNVYVIEFSARTGGGVKYLLIERTSGFNVINAVVDLTLGIKPHVGSLKAEQKYLINDFVYCKPGVFDHLEGFEKCLQENILRDYYLFKWKGAEFNKIRASGDRIAGYTITGSTPEEVIEKHKLVQERIKVIATDGTDIARHDLLVPLCNKNGFLYSAFGNS